MTSTKAPSFAKKHAAGTAIIPEIEKAIVAKCSDGELPCAVAFAIVEETGQTAEAVGRTADLMGVRLAKCQLGLFGYGPEKKIVSAAAEVPESLANALRGALRNDRLPCADAWRIAREAGIGRMAVSAACEALGIKIKPCQLGAF